MQHRRILGNKAIQSLCRKSNHLALETLTPTSFNNAVSRAIRHLSLLVQHQAKPPGVWAVASDDSCRQGRQ